MSDPRPKVVYEHVGPEDEHVFVIVGANGEVQARSERYDSKFNAERGFRDLLDTLTVLAAD